MSEKQPGLEPHNVNTIPNSAIEEKKNPNPGQTPLFGFVVWFISNFHFILFKEEKLKMGFWRREEQVKDREKHPEVDIPSDWNYFTHWISLLVPSWYDLISSCITGPKFNFKRFFFQGNMWRMECALPSGVDGWPLAQSPQGTVSKKPARSRLGWWPASLLSIPRNKIKKIK